MSGNTVPLSPYRIEGPALVSFSGGRTSARMLYEILRAHGGELPSDVHVAFANTGRERPETLDFVRECGTRWSVDIHWLEYCGTEPGFTQVSYYTAARAGEPFQSLIDRKKRLPNWDQRWCTQLLKVQPMIDFMRSLGQEPGSYVDVIGLRYDEGLRIIRPWKRVGTCAGGGTNASASPASSTRPRPCPRSPKL